jgi:hypothetical protein
MNPVVIVLAARFEQQHADVGIFGQAVREHAAGRARADDHVIEFALERALSGHDVSPELLCAARACRAPFSA